MIIPPANPCSRLANPQNLDIGAMLGLNVAFCAGNVPGSGFESMWFFGLSILG